MDAYHAGGFNGVGFVFDGEVGDDGLCFGGADFDGCIEVASDGKRQIVSFARERLRRLQSYTEKSVSGEGVHCIVRARPLPRAAISKGAELYTNNRYFTFTGHGGGAIVSAPDAFRALAEEVWAEQGLDKRHQGQQPEPTEARDPETPSGWYACLLPER